MLSDDPPLLNSFKSYSCLNNKSTLPTPPPERACGQKHPTGHFKSFPRDDITQRRSSKMDNSPPSDRPERTSSLQKQPNPDRPRPHRRGKRRRGDMSDDEHNRSRSASLSPSEVSSAGGTQEGHSMFVEQHISGEGGPPPKKKRTRTLTTPHQSAVLHSLLAQSRFPTTAMREEVGRQIGLSPRKVQVWFQNQRQKAKRPKAGGESAPASPAQFAPYPNPSTHFYSSQAGSGPSQPTNPSQRPSRGSADTSPRQLLSGATNVYPPVDPAQGSYSNEFSASAPSGLVSQLTGPGVPGRTMLIDPYERPGPYNEMMSEHRSTLSRGVPRAADLSSSSHSLSSTRQHNNYDYPRALSPRSSVGSPLSPVSHHPQPSRPIAHSGQVSTSVPVGRHGHSHSGLRSLQPAIHEAQRHTSVSGMVTADLGSPYLTTNTDIQHGSHTHSSSRITRFDPVRSSSERITSPRPPSRLHS